MLLLLCVITLGSCDGKLEFHGPTEPGGLNSPLSAATEVWFTPNADSQDFLNLFTNPEQWNTARAKVDVFKFYAAPLRGNTDLTSTNIHSNFVEVGAYEKIRSWGMDIAIETGAYKGFSCNADPHITSTARSIDSVGGVQYVAMDWPLGAWKSSCQAQGHTLDDAAAEVARYITELKQRYSGLKIGDIEGAPFFTPNEIRQWITALERHGVSLDFFHFDNSRMGALGAQTNLVAVMRDLGPFFQEHNIKVGIIFWGEDASSNEAFAQNVLRYIRFARSAGVPHHAIFQSWERTQRGVLTMPDNLPEKQRGTHTWLINAGLDALK